MNENKSDETFHTLAQGDQGAMQRAVSGAMQALPAAPSSAQMQVKLENPEFFKMGDKLRALRSAKTIMEKNVSAAEDLICGFEAVLAKGDPKDAWISAKKEEVEQSLQGMKQFVNEVRSMVLLAGSLTTKDDVTGVKENLVEKGTEAVAHIDGWKIMSKRMKGYING